MSKIIKEIKDRSYNAVYGKGVYKLLYMCYNLCRMTFDPAYRSRVVSSLRFKNDYHQFSNATETDRYPDLFNIAKEYFKEIEKPKLLSFGCSTGEEIASIARYVPHAELTGTDINPWCIKKADEKYGSENRRFVHSLSEDFTQLRDLDAVFCLAVFQHPANRHEKDRKESAMPFEKFENQLKVLDKKLKPGGLIFLDHCDFNFMETSLMPHYSILNAPSNPKVRERPLFNKDNRKIAEVSKCFRVFQKK